MNDLGVGVANGRHVKKTWCLVRNDKALAVRAHLGNGVGNHLDALTE